MPMGKGTYGSKKGRPKKRQNIAKRPTGITYSGPSSMRNAGKGSKKRKK